MSEKPFKSMNQIKWSWITASESSINADCEHMESEGWRVVAIVLTNPGDVHNGNWYKVFMRREDCE